jgi:cyclase
VELADPVAAESADLLDQVKQIRFEKHDPDATEVKPMCNVTRRSFLGGGAALLGAAARGGSAAGAAEVGKVDEVAENVYFHEGDHRLGHSNNGWVIFEDYVLVIDANYPSGASEIIPKIRALTNKPIRFAFDTHHHGDHAYGNQVLMENGATPVAHTGVIEEMKRYETGYYDAKPGRWEQLAETRADVRASRLKPPSVLFPRELIFDDGKRRVELRHLGVAHTHGDAFAWLPKEGILFSGDACVNGPYNYAADGNIEQWVRTLESAKKLDPRVVCPGHGPRGEGGLLSDQQTYFQSIRREVERLLTAHQSAEEVRRAVDGIRARLSADQRIARYVSVGGRTTNHIEKAFNEATGKSFPATRNPGEARLEHARQHGLDLHRA